MREGEAVGERPIILQAALGSGVKIERVRRERNGYYEIRRKD